MTFISCAASVNKCKNILNAPSEVDFLTTDFKNFQQTSCFKEKPTICMNQQHVLSCSKVYRQDVKKFIYLINNTKWCNKLGSIFYRISIGKG